jgi:hypothetical protein
MARHPMDIPQIPINVTREDIFNKPAYHIALINKDELLFLTGGFRLLIVEKPYIINLQKDPIVNV